MFRTFCTTLWLLGLALLSAFPATAQQTVDLGITKSDQLSTTSPGASVSYLLTVVNNGPATLTNLRVVDNLPLVFLNPTYTPSKGSYNPVTGEWTGLTFAQGESIFLEIKGNISATATPGTILNTAQVYPPAGYTDTNTANNNCEDKTDIPGGSSTADLGIVKSDSRSTVNAGEVLTYLITVINNGPATLNEIRVVDVLPPYVSATRFEASEGTYNAGTGVWTGINFGTGGTLFLQITALVSASAPGGTTLINTAYVYPPSGVTDSKSDNNICQDGTTVNGSNPPPPSQADLGITKSDNKTSVNPGAASTYTLTIVNNGPSTVTSMTVIDNLPQYFVGPYTYTTKDSNGQVNVGTYNSQTGVWSGINFAPGSTLFLEISGTVSATAPTGTLINMASVSTPAGVTDPKLDNNTCDDKTDVTGPDGADLSVKKTASSSTPNAGDNLEYTIEVTNNGPSTAQVVSVTDRLPVGVTFGATVSATQGAYNAQTGIWDLGTLTSGATATLKLRVSVNNGAPTEIKNCAKASAQTNDPNSANNEGCVSVTPKGVSCSCDAGVESNGDFALSMARRVFNRQQISGAGPQISESTALGKTEASILNEVVPVVGPNGAPGYDQTWAVSDLMTEGITKAKALYAVDYTQNQGARRVAGIFSALTEGHHYEHAKVTCDRFGTHTLDEVRTIEIAGNPFILSKILRSDGLIDYAVTFTARKVGNTFLVDSRNSTVEYSLPNAKDEQVLTFEVWTLSPENTALMVQEVLKKLQTKGSVTINNTKWNSPDLPQVFIRKGRYAQGKLTLEIANPKGLKTAKLVGQVSGAEGKTNTVRHINLDLSLDGKAQQLIEIPTNGPIFDASLELTDGTRKGIDQLYYADGTWSYNAPSVVKNVAFEVAPQTAFVPISDSYLVERNVSFAGALSEALPSGQYLNVFRTIRAGGAATDMTAYNAIQFVASGRGKIEFVAEKAGLAGNQQYRTVFDLNADYPKTYTIRYAQLSNGTGTPFVADDLRWLSFYFLPAAGTSYPQNLSIELKDVKFIANATPLPDAFVLHANYPNPFNPTTTIEFTVPKTADVKIAVYDILGRELSVLTNANYRPGVHTVVFDAGKYPSGVYVYRMYVGDSVVSRRMVIAK